VRYLGSLSHRVTCALLRELREKAGWTTRQLSKKLRRAQNFTTLVENGHRMLNTSEFIVYTRTLGMRASRAMAIIERRTGSLR
jgi:hypothetical protein